MITYLQPPIIPHGGHGEIFGRLYSSDRPEELGQDMLDVSFPNGAMISAGWVPEGSPVGTYEVTVTRDFECLESPFYTQDVYEAQSYVQSKVHSLSFGSPQYSSNSTSVYLHSGESSGCLVNA